MTQLSLYQSLIAKSRYSRYLDGQYRRENWNETVARYCDFIQEHMLENYSYQINRAEIESAILNQEVMPSMRGLMTAGKAAKRDNTCVYNCSYIVVDDIKAFDEAMFILLCGTGVGFSCEQKYIRKLPEIPEKLYESETVIKVSDSKEGWAKAFRQLIYLLYAGEIPKYDTSKIRKEGSRLKTFGGRASGPGPLIGLFEFVISVFKNAAGRRLTELEVHDILCKIGEIVVVGGVRRAALISLSDLESDRMRHAKAGKWWETQKQRELANNSAVYESKPDIGQFMREWIALYDSKSGERGIFNREAARKQAAKNGRRKTGFDFGCNPCSLAGDSLLLTTKGYRRLDELAEIGEADIVNHLGGHSKGNVWAVGERETVVVKVFGYALENIRCTPDHVFMLEDGSECEARDLAGKRLMMYQDEWNRGDIRDGLVYEVEDAGKTMVFDFEEPETNWAIVNRFVAHNSEIILRPNQFCNLTEVVVRTDDDEESLARKVRIATILGTIQSTLTHFPYLRKVWASNTQEERLLGVSLTGVLDNEALGAVCDSTGQMLSRLRQIAIDTNESLSAELGIQQSTAITCVKPSGTASQLVDSASGLHARHDHYYIRRVRNDMKDPITQFLVDAGVPAEPCVSRPESTMVFSFPIKAPEGARTRNDLGAIEHLKLWLQYQRHWCEHKPSVTIYVKEHEWLEVGAWVYEHFDEISGISFLPYDGGVYQQAPYETIDEARYNEMNSHMPSDINWDLLVEFDDNVQGAQMLACSSGVCEI